MWLLQSIEKLKTQWKLKSCNTLLRHMRSFKNKNFRHGPTIKEKTKVFEKGINPTPIRITKIKNLARLVNPLKEGEKTKHRSKVATPKIARSGRSNSNFEIVMLLATTSNAASNDT
ncbi:hypothetical protein CR513_53921, partial [Mucuna pruriens]